MRLTRVHVARRRHLSRRQTVFKNLLLGSALRPPSTTMRSRPMTNGVGEQENRDLQLQKESHAYLTDNFVIRALVTITTWYHSPLSGHAIFLFSKFSDGHSKDQRSSWLRTRWSGVRISPGAPNDKGSLKGTHFSCASMRRFGVTANDLVSNSVVHQDLYRRHYA